MFLRVQMLFLLPFFAGAILLHGADASEKAPEPPLLPVVNEIDLKMPIQHARATGVTVKGKHLLLVRHANSPRVDPAPDHFVYPTDSYKLSLLDLNANKVLWTKDLGWGIIAGDWFCPVLSFDIDDDGSDEIFFIDNELPKKPLSFRRSLVGLRAEDGREFLRFRVKVEKDYRFILMGGKNKKGAPVLIVQNGTYRDMNFFAYDQKGKMLWRRLITQDGTPRASHCTSVFDYNGDGSDEILWGERMISIDNGKDLFLGNEDAWNGHSDIVMPYFDRNYKFSGVWTCRESRPTKDHPEQFRCNNYDPQLHIRWGALKEGHIDRGGIFRINAEGDKAFWAQEMRADPVTLKRSFMPTLFFGEDGKELNLPLKRRFSARAIDVNGDGIHEIICDRTIYDLKGNALYRVPVRDKWMIVGHLRDDLPGEQYIMHTTDGKIRVLADPNAKWSESAKKRYAHPYYDRCLHRSAVGYNFAYDLGGL